MWFLILAILVPICLIAYSVYLTLQPREGAWERLIKCSEMSQALAETAVIYRKIGMDEAANDCWYESQRLNEEVTAIMTGNEP